jgi:SAM-dependent methyltransferase
LKSVVDIGGGEGKLLTALLAANPHMKGVLFEQARVIEKARNRIAVAGMAARCDAVAGDFFAAIPRGGDAYILSRVLHDWEDARAMEILQNCRAAMAPGARLLLIERVVPARIKPTPAMRAIAASDVHMMVMNGGQERTEAHYRALLEAAGLTLTRIVPAGSVMSVVEARLA